MRFIIPLILLFALDLYFFQAIRTLSTDFGNRPRLLVYTIYWGFSLLIYLMMIAALEAVDVERTTRYYLGSFIMISVVSKLFGSLFLGIEDLVRLVESIIGVISQDGFALKGRRRAFSKIGLTLFSLPFISMIYGMVGNAFRMTAKEVDVWLPKLPDGWDGAVIAQVSDMHLGSLSSTTIVDRAADLINQRQVDLLLFTGDMVNAVASEAEPFVRSMANINAKLGKYSVLGNHDYGDYANWNTVNDKVANLEQLADIQARSGFRLLKNESVSVSRKGESISLLGLENWGASKHFPKYGDLEKTLSNVPVDSVKILMSHDPSHWEQQVTGKTDIDLALAGHTHGFQFGIEIPGFIKWSPVQYVYKQWAGLYERAGQFLYVNRGLGFLGYMGRVGIPAEVTFITLRKRKQAVIVNCRTASFYERSCPQ